MTLKELNIKCSCFAKKVQKCTESKHCSQTHRPLSESCHPGKVKICKITGDRKLCARMASLGVRPGEEAELICPRKGSQCLLKIQGGMLSLDHNMTSNIIVQAV